MTRPATSAEQARSIELGLALVAKVQAFVEAETAKLVGADRLRQASDDARAQEIGRWLVLSVLAAGNELSWLDRRFVLAGAGHALGELCGQAPHAAGVMIEAFELGMHSGHARAAEAFRAQGAA